MTTSALPFSLDIQALYRQSGTDILMFLTAMLGYWMLQRVKQARATSLKIPCSKSQECPCYSTSDIVDIQTPPPKACKVDSKHSQAVASQPQPRLEKASVVPNPPKPAVAVQKQALSVHERLSLMRNYAASGKIKDTLREFEAIQQNAEPVTSAMYNSVLQAWINCGNIWAAENCLDQARDAGLVDETSFVTLVKALVLIGDLEKARALVDEMKETVPSPRIASFDALLLCFARAGLLNDGVCLLKHMHERGVQPAQATLCAVAKLLTGARCIQLKSSEIWQVLLKYDFDSKRIDELVQKYPCELPRLLAVVSQADACDAKKCIHEVEIKGNIAGIEAAVATLTQPDFMKELGTADRLLDGQRDEHQDTMKRAQAAAVLRCVSKQGLHLPWSIEESMLQYLGSDVYFLRLNFDSNSIRVPLLDEFSCRHPRLGLRHCWVKPSFGSCGQRTLSNAEEIDESAFNRHINAEYRKEMS